MNTKNSINIVVKFDRVPCTYSFSISKMFLLVCYDDLMPTDQKLGIFSYIDFLKVVKDK